MTLAERLRVALEVAPGVGELHLVQRLLGDRLVELRLVGDGVDLRQQVALLDLLAFLEIDRQDLAVDLRAHGDEVARLGRADALQPDGHVGELGLGGDDRHRPFRPRPPPPALGLLAALGEIDGRRRHRPDDQNGKHRFEELFHPAVLSLARTQTRGRKAATLRRLPQNGRYG